MYNRKYRINDLLEAMEKPDRRAAILELRSLLDISKSQFNRIRFCPINGSPNHSNASIDQMKICADFFGVTVDELLTQVTAL